MTSTSSAPWRASPIFSGWKSPAHFTKPLALSGRKIYISSNPFKDQSYGNGVDAGNCQEIRKSEKWGRRQLFTPAGDLSFCIFRSSVLDIYDCPNRRCLVLYKKRACLLMAALAAVLRPCPSTGIRRRLKLTIRNLPNGTTQMPAVQGTITGHAGLWTRVVFGTPEKASRPPSPAYPPTKSLLPLQAFSRRRPRSAAALAAIGRSRLFLRCWPPG